MTRISCSRLFFAMVAAWLSLSSALFAHEVLPIIGDMERKGQSLDITLSGAFEPILAGLDLEGLEDTTDAPGNARAEALRALPPVELAARLTSFWPEVQEAVAVLVDGTPQDIRLRDVTVSPVGDVTLARRSVLRLSVALPETATAVQVDWPAQYGALVLRQHGVDTPWDGYLTGGLTDPIPLAGGGQASPWTAFGKYIPVGIAHIVPMGLDHILFVLGLFFLAPGIRPLLLQVTAFTAAHTITLALAALDIVSVPGSIVEPLIAASIVYVAIENIFTDGLHPWRPVVIFGFGLLHGLGFASVLAEFGIPEGNFIPALLGFNVGVELGQLMVIAVAFVAVWQALRIDRGHMDELRRGRRFYAAAVIGALICAALPITLEGAQIATLALPLAGLLGLCFVSLVRPQPGGGYRRMVAIPASLAIALVGLWWVIERVFL